MFALACRLASFNAFSRENKYGGNRVILSAGSILNSAIIFPVNQKSFLQYNRTVYAERMNFQTNFLW
jgi:hypothetical protein